MPLTHVLYRESVSGVTDILGSQLASMFTPSGDFLANHKAGKTRMMATSGPARLQFSPDVPTFAEQGFSELTTDEWFGFHAPAKTPPGIISNANEAMNAALKHPAVVTSLATFGLTPAGSTVREGLFMTVKRAAPALSHLSQHFKPLWLSSYNQRARTAIKAVATRNLRYIPASECLPINRDRNVTRRCPP